jgi:hypothetical protein
MYSQGERYSRQVLVKVLPVHSLLAHYVSIPLSGYRQTTGDENDGNSHTAD